MKIDKFDDQYRFLSNFYPCVVHSYDPFDNLIYPSVEHAFQAAKTEDMDMRLEIKRAITPGRAKRLGRKLTLRDNWYLIRRQVMLTLLREKFDPHTHLALWLKLRNTKDYQLIEGNEWHDNFWGVCSCMACYGDEKYNWLGKLLEHVRFENIIKLGLE